MIKKQYHFSIDAAQTPDIYSHGVPLGPEQDLRGAVPKRDHLVGVVPCGHRERSRQAKVRQLDDAVVVEK